MITELLKKNLGEKNYEIINMESGVEGEIEIELYGEESEIYSIVKNIKEKDFTKKEDMKNFLKEYEFKRAIFIFSNLTEQMQVYHAIRNNKKVTNILKNELIDFIFEDSLILYSDSEEIKLEFRKEDYLLEYISDINGEMNSFIKGLVLNIPFSKLHDVYNLTGRHTFRHNVREGLKGTLVKPIYDNFLEVISNNIREKMNLKIVEKIQTSTTDKNIISNVGKIFELDNKVISTKNFWFHHNGISVVYDGEIKFLTPNTISVLPEKFKIINGAQTTTTLFKIFYEIEELENKVNYSKEAVIKKFLNDKDIDCSDEDVYEELKNLKLINNAETNDELIKKIMEVETANFKEVVELVKEEIVLKTTIITITKDSDDKKEIVESITKGLNTQIAVDLDSLFTSEQREKIRKSYQVILTKPGERENGSKMSPLKFVKNLRTFHGQPGEARNFNKSQLLKKLDSIIKESQVDSSKFKIFIDNVGIMENVYRKKRREDEKGVENSNLKSLMSNGLYYYKSFIAKYYLSEIKKLEFQDMDLSERFLDLLKEFDKLFLKVIENSDKYSIINSNTFKNDDLWKEIESYKDEIIARELAREETIKINVEKIEKYFSRMISSIDEDGNDNLILLKQHGLQYFKYFFKQYYEELLSDSDLEIGKIAVVYNDFGKTYLNVIAKDGEFKNVNVSTFEDRKLWIAISAEKEKTEKEKTRKEEIVEEILLLSEDNKEGIIRKIIELINLEAEDSRAKSKFSNIINGLVKSQIIPENILKRDVPFRTIRISNQKPYKQYESFPLPRDSFMEFSEKYDEEVIEKKYKFENSEFKKCLTDNMQYIILKVSEDNKVSDFLVFDNILNKEDVIIEGKIFFETLKKHFNNGDAEFKNIDSEYFHIRPKAANSSDTFTFTNGDEVVKSTIWINKSKMSDIIGELLASEE